MDFDPKQSILSSQKEVYDYLIRYRSRLSSMIMVEFCPATMDVKVSPPPEGVYFHPQILALGVPLALTQFIRSILGYYHVSPAQLSSGVWRTILAFEALCCTYIPSSYGLDEFCTIYVMMKTRSNVCGVVDIS